MRQLLLIKNRERAERISSAITRIMTLHGIDTGSDGIQITVRSSPPRRPDKEINLMVSVGAREFRTVMSEANFDVDLRLSAHTFGEWLRLFNN